MFIEQLATAPYLSTDYSKILLPVNRSLSLIYLSLIYLLRVIVNAAVDPKIVVTVYRTSKIDK